MGRKNPGRHDTHRLPSSEMPPSLLVAADEVIE